MENRQNVEKIPNETIQRKKKLIKIKWKQNQSVQ